MNDSFTGIITDIYYVEYVNRTESNSTNEIRHHIHPLPLSRESNTGDELPSTPLLSDHLNPTDMSIRHDQQALHVTLARNIEFEYIHSSTEYYNFPLLHKIPMIDASSICKQFEVTKFLNVKDSVLTKAYLNQFMDSNNYWLIHLHITFLLIFMLFNRFIPQLISVVKASKKYTLQPFVPSIFACPYLT